MKTTKSETKVQKNERLNEVFGWVAKVYGYDECKANFEPLKEFKAKWQRTYKWAEFTVSDYLDEAPVEVLESLATTLFKKIAGQDTTYSPEMKQYVMSDDFIKLKQGSYLRRQRVKKNTDSSKLKSRISALKKSGKIAQDDNLVITMGKPSGKHAGQYSSLFKTIIVHEDLLKDDVPDYVVDYVIMHEYEWMMHGRSIFGHKYDCDPFVPSVYRTVEGDKARTYIENAKLIIG